MRCSRTCRRLAVALAVLFFGAAGLTHGQSASGVSDTLKYRFRLMGIYDSRSGAPLEGVDVVDIFSRTKGTTGKSGLLSLFYLPDGGTMVRVQKIGFAPQTMLVAITPADTTPLTVILERATELAPTIVTADSTRIGIRTPRMQAFDQRRRASIGSFISDSVLRADESQTLSNILRARLSGAHIQVMGRGSVLMSTRAGSGASCRVDVFLDNVQIPGQNVNLDNFQASDIEAIEFYAGGAQLPVQFQHTGSGCGVLLLWSREG